MVLSFVCRLPEFALSTDRGVRWTDEVSAGRTKCPLDGRSVRWTDKVSAGRTQRPLDGQYVRWTDEVGRGICRTGEAFERDGFPLEGQTFLLYEFSYSNDWQN